MAPEQKQEEKKKEEKKSKTHDDDSVGKAFDSRLMRRLMGYLRPYTGHALLSSLAILLKASSDVVGPYLVKVAVDTYMVHEPGFKPGWLAQHLSASPIAGVTQLAALYLIAIVISWGLEFLQTYLMQWTGQRIMFDIRSQLFRHLQRMDVSFYDHNPVGRLVTRVTSDVDALNEMFTSGVLAIFEDIFVLLFIVIVMVRMNPLLALITLSVIPAIFYCTKLFRDYVRQSYRRQRAATARINSFTQEYVSGMAVVQMFNREQRAFKDFSAVNFENKEAWTDAIFAYALYYPAVELLSSTAIALVIWRGGMSVLNGFVTIGVLIAFMQYAQRFFRPIQDLSEKYNILQSAMAASERIFKLLDTAPAIASPAHTIEGDRTGSVEFRNVWFTYQRLNEAQAAFVASASEEELRADTQVEWILKGVSFTIQTDETAAIVGHTGAGKTTITSLMMRFYDVQRGEVLVDGVDVRLQNLNHLRRRFGVVLQDPFLFTGTIAQNIRLGSDWITDDQLNQAVEDVNLSHFIHALPNGLNEPVTERGATFSTGQKQLISFARALAHRPGILILDEATSSVDTETELLVRSAVDRMIAGRTAVMIAHRLSTIQKADTILVMHKGLLREQGTHQQLLAQRGLYWKLYQLQYKDQELGEDAPSAMPAQTAG